MITARHGWRETKFPKDKNVLATRRCYDVIMIHGVASRASQAVLLCSMALGRSFVYCADTVFRPYGSAVRDRMRSLRDRRIMKFAGAGRELYPPNVLLAGVPAEIKKELSPE